MATNIVPQSFMTPPAEFASPDSVARRRKVAEAMMGQGIDTSPVGHPFQAIARVLQAGIGGYNMRQADQAEKAGTANAYSKIVDSLMTGQGTEPEMMADVASDEWVNPAIKAMMLQRYADSRKPKEKKWDTFTTKTGDVMRVDQNADTPDPQMVYDEPDQPPGLDKDSLTAVTGLRKEIQDLPSYKNLSQAAPVYQSMVETSQRDNKASDLNLVYGLAKLFDPNSVVREGEMVMVQNVENLPGRLVAMINEVNTKARLGKELRHEIMQEAQSRMNSYKGAFDSNMKQFNDMAQRYHFNPADIAPTMQDVPPLPESQPEQGASPPQTQPEQQGSVPPPPPGVSPLEWQHMTPEERALWNQ